MRSPKLALAILAFSLSPEVRAETQSPPAPVACSNCWRPSLETSWQWNLLRNDGDKKLAPPFADVDVYDIDYQTSPEIIKALKERRARRLICYMSAGTYEDWRDDAKIYKDNAKVLLGNSVVKDLTLGSHWVGEQWVNIKEIRWPNSVLARILRARLDICASKGFDAVEFDNVDAFSQEGKEFAGNFYEKPGGPKTKHTPADQLYFNAWLANEAHMRGLSAGLKNDISQIPQLLAYFDWALNEQCFEQGECLTSDHDGEFGYDQFVKAGKAVFGVAYPGEGVSFRKWAATAKQRTCPKANAANFNWLLKTQDPLDETRIACR